MTEHLELALGLRDRTTPMARFHEVGVLGLADVHTATALGRIGGEADPDVLLAVALTVRSLRGGSVCLDLTTARDWVFESKDEEVVDAADLPWPEPEEWVSTCAASPLVTVGADGDGDRPLRLIGSVFYLERYWAEEETVRQQLQTRRELPADTSIDLDRLRAGLDRVFSPDELDPDEADRQRIAAAVAVLGRVTVLAGGPGTGKTTTVAKLLALLADQPDGADQRVALAAPTGKAAARLAEAVREATAALPEADAARVGTWSALTMHRLLGSIPNTPGRFRHDSENRLPHDVIVIDEMSMVSLPMMARLLEAVRPHSRVVLVGDPDQLTSVEAGAVMADVTGAALDSAHRAPALGGMDGDDPETSDPYEPLADLVDDGRGVDLPPDVVDGVVRLTHTWRFGGAIGELATAIRTGDADAAVEIVTAGHDDVRFIEVADEELRADAVPQVRDRVVATATRLADAATTGDRQGALRALEAHRLLCGHRTGPYGVSRWTREVERWLDLGHGLRDEWYPGRPLLITNNDYDLNLFNGDTGVVVETPRGLRAVFARGPEWVEYAPARLTGVQTVHAMTVHRGQGSQFGDVSFVLPPVDSPLLTRELVYTAVTRATTTVCLVGTAESIRRAVLRPANRASGLRQRL
ncbi:exodeoxyribonuclease V subunit alpha [Propionibacteriaceae bacterium Y2011]